MLVFKVVQVPALPLQIWNMFGMFDAAPVPMLCTNDWNVTGEPTVMEVALLGAVFESVRSGCPLHVTFMVAGEL
jgi:hypothetical protein